MSQKQEKLPLEAARDLIFVLNRLPIPPLTSEQVIERGLLLAKPVPSDDEMIRAAVFYHYSGFATGQLSTHLQKHLPRSTAVEWWNENEVERRQFRGRLAELINDPSKATSRVRLDLELLDREMLIAAGIDFETGEIIHKFFPLTTEAGYKFVLLKLCSNARWKRLKICGFEKCGAIFYRRPSKAGGRPRIYCTPECQLLADQQKALDRQKKQRRRKKTPTKGHQL